MRIPGYLKLPSCIFGGIFFALFWLCPFLNAVAVEEVISEPTGGDPLHYDLTGELQSIEKNGIVIIDKKTYLLDKDLLVVNDMDRPISIKKLNLPVNIFFVYSYHRQNDGSMEPVIVYIKKSKNTRQNEGEVQ